MIHHEAHETDASDRPYEHSLLTHLVPVDVASKHTDVVVHGSLREGNKAGFLILGQVRSDVDMVECEEAGHPE